jgi:DNA-binding response OmpR family regulator
VGLRLEDGVLTGADGRWVALPGLEARLFALLLGRSEAVVDRPALLAAGWPGGPPADPRAVDGVLRRLRRRVAHLGVTIYAVPGGYLLDHSASVSVPATATA